MAEQTCESVVEVQVKIFEMVNIYLFMHCIRSACLLNIHRGSVVVVCSIFRYMKVRYSILLLEVLL